MKKPRVSVLLPTYNGAKLITKSIESVLGQSFEDLELIVVDDGSADYTPDVVREFAQKDKRVLFVSNAENLGIQKTLNKGLGLAKGEYIARIDDDDEWIRKDKLAEQVDFLDQHADHVLVGTGAVVVDESREEIFRFLEPADDASIRDRLLFRSCFMHSAVLFRKRDALELGGYGESGAVRHVEDYDLWLRLGRVGKLANLPLHGINFMQREGAITSKHKSEQFRKIIRLVKAFRSDYPHARMAILFAYLRSWLFMFDKTLPFPALRNWFIKQYKSV